MYSCELQFADESCKYRCSRYAARCRKAYRTHTHTYTRTHTYTGFILRVSKQLSVPSSFCRVPIQMFDDLQVLFSFLLFLPRTWLCSRAAWPPLTWPAQPQLGRGVRRIAPVPPVGEGSTHTSPLCTHTEQPTRYR